VDVEAPESKARPALATMLTWGGVDASRLEAVRVVVGDRGIRATGSVIAAATDAVPAYSASYSLSTDEAGVIGRFTVRTTTSAGEQHVTLSRSEEGIWLVDHGSGVARTEFDGAVDVDLAGSPLLAALPMRRLGLHRLPSEHELPMVFVDLPSLDVELTQQTYRTVSVGPERSVVCFATARRQAELTVDADGLVIDYPGLARRL
jgi:hypothetical protein